MKETMKRAVAVFFMWVLMFIFSGTAIGDEINIGFTGPQTGPAAYLGVDSLHGALIAAKEINDAGGVVVAEKKYTVKIHVYDDELNAAKAVAGMQRLKDRYSTPVIIQNSSACIMGMLEKNEAMGVLLIGFFKHPEALKKGNKLALRHENTVGYDVGLLVEGTVKILKPKTYAMLSDVSDNGKTYEQLYKPLFEKMGVKMVANEWLDQRSQTDFRSQLTKIKAANPDVIMLSAYDEASAGAIKQAHELGIKTPFAVTSGFQSVGQKLTGPALIEGYIRVIQYHDQVPVPPAIVRYKTQLYPAMGYKEPAGPYGLAIYAATHTIVKAMEKAGTTTDASKIRQAAPLVVPIDKKYNTHGLKAWDATGEGAMASVIGRFRNGELVPVK